MLRGLLFWLTGWLRVRIIRVNDAPYLERYLLAEFPLGLGALYIHRFLASDPPERCLHNHPWTSLSFVLAGGYDEHRWVSGRVVTVRVRPLRFNLITAERLHRVNLLEKDAWSLFLRGGTSHGWGFLAPAGEPPPGSYVSSLPLAGPQTAWTYSPAHEESDVPGFWATMPRGRGSDRSPLG